MTNNNKCYCTDKICCQYCSTSGIEYDKPMTNIKKKKELIEESKNVHRLALKGALSEYQLYIWLNIKLKEQREDIAYSVSEWKRIGKERGYDKYFEKKIIKEQREDIVEKIKENSTDSANLFGEAILIEDITKLIKQ